MGHKVGQRHTQETKNKISKKISISWKEHPERYKYFGREWRDSNWLYEQYVINEKSSLQIATECGCSDETIRTWMHKFNIKVRSRSDSLKIYCSKNKRKSPWNKGLTAKSCDRIAEYTRRVKATWNTPEKKASITGNNNPMKRPDVKAKHKKMYSDPTFKAKICEIRKISNNNPEVLKKRSITMKRTWDKYNPNRREILRERMTYHNPMQGKTPPKGAGITKRLYYRTKSGSKLTLRSTYEYRIAEILDKLGLKWKYESKTFAISEKSTYTPDFLIEDKIHWEVKGYWRESAKEKVNKFWELYPNENLKIVYLSDIKQMEQKIKSNQHICIYNIGKNHI